MDGQNRTVLLVDDEQKFLNSIAARLKLMGFEPLTATSGEAALDIARKNPIDLAIVDLKMPGLDGLVTITKLKEIDPGIKSVLLTAYGSKKIEQATEALDADYFEKDRMASFWDFIKNSSQKGDTIIIRPASRTAGDAGDGRADAMLPGKIEILSEPKPEGSDRTAGQESSSGNAIDAGQLRMIGETPAIQQLRRHIQRLAGLDCAVIIRGETGTGKELTARMIHQSSPRRHDRFMAINCGCFSNDLLIEEVLNSDRMARGSGDFDIPSGDRAGSGGTILLDQIEELSDNLQLSMLKLIDSKETSGAGGAAMPALDARFLAASSHDLRQRVEEGNFREELYHRLNVLELFIPPLRERRDDIPPLCGYFLNRFADVFGKNVFRISEAVLSIFMAYDFPGNVRELEHVIERAVILADDETIRPGHLPDRFQKSARPSPAKELISLAELEKRHILEVIEATGGNKSKAVGILGISRAALWRKLKQYEADAS
jgi:two-component system response regulator AtoC